MPTNTAATDYLDSIPNPSISAGARAPYSQRKAFLEKVEWFERYLSEAKQTGQTVDPDGAPAIALVLAFYAVGNLDTGCLTAGEINTLRAATAVARKWAQTKLALPTGNAFTPVFQAVLNMATR